MGHSIEAEIEQPSEVIEAEAEPAEAALGRKKKTAKERKRTTSAAIGRLLDLARAENAAPPTDGQQVKIFREWEKSEKVIRDARQLLKDAFKRREDAVTDIVKRLGPGPYRWRDKLYLAASNGDTVYLRELPQRPK